MSRDDDLREGQRLGEEGGARALANTLPAWKALAKATLLGLAKETYQSLGDFSAEDVTAIVGMPPAVSGTHNGVGGIFQWASKKGLVKVVGRAPSTRPDRHGNNNNLWRGTAKAMTFFAPDVAIPQEPRGQQSIFEAVWRCTVCDTEVMPTVVTAHVIAPKYGEAWCPKCLKKRMFQFR